MSTTENQIEPLVAGDKLNRDEFLRRWEAMPHVRKAELIGGIVYMPSPVSLEHGDAHAPLVTWLGTYEAATPGCRTGADATWLMLDDAPQPDAHLRILPEYGGQSRIHRGFGYGAPELAAEICRSSTSYDRNQKFDLYRAAGVQEYLTVLLKEKCIEWHRLAEGDYEPLTPGADGILRSAALPGLWLDAAALLRGDLARVLSVVQDGIRSPEHAEFLMELESRRANG